QGIYTEFGTPPLSESEVNIGHGNGSSSTYPYYVQKTGHTVPPAPVHIVTGSIRQFDSTSTSPRVAGTKCPEQYEGVLCQLDSVEITKKYNQFFEANLRQIRKYTLIPSCMTTSPSDTVDTCRVDDKLIDPSDSTTWT